ncbi:ammonium transporter Rh type A [Ixodes scapularis]|uniref:ammonium transporter Rh type A n=1 Tax=Ixodes scapularis TaxID=6945 RepID=UPI001AD76D8C|nr:ammonium transporter Rh type A [Ixodes scapularis]
MWKRGKLGMALLVVQVAFIIAYALCVQYEEAADASNGRNSLAEALGGNDPKENSIEKYYPMFQDVNVMVFVGFGFLMTFLKRYSFSAVGFTLLIAALTIQWAILMRGAWDTHDGKILIDVTGMIGAEFTAAVVLISFGAVLGKTSPLQLLVMAIIEVVIFACNEHLGIEKLFAVDIGGSIFLHTFGAYFGLAVTFVLNKKEYREHSKDGSVYHSDVFAMIGTLFLWLFWPSFNGALAFGDARHRAVINTFMCLLACTVTAFAVSSLLDSKNRFNMVHIQNSTVAGGVAMGATADMMVHPYGAFIIGSVAGALSVFGYKFITPFLSRRLRIHDTCGINNLHGMPGILAGIVSAVVAASATEEEYNYSLYTLYPARAPPENSTDLEQIRFYTMAVHAGLGRSASSQGLFQLAALACTLAIAIGGGLLTGLIMKLKFFDAPSVDELFDDETWWEIEEDEAATEATPAAPRPPSKGNQIAMIETQPDSARARLPAHFNGAYDVSASP